VEGPAEAIADLRAQLAPCRDMFATMVYATLGPLPGTVVVASAGHPPPLIVGPGGSVCFLEGGLGPALGVPWSEAQAVVATELPPGCTLVLYTDGLVESARRQLDEGLERLASVAGAAAGAPLSELCRRLVGVGLEEGEPTDDLTAIAVRTGTGVRRGPTALGSWVSTTWSLPRALRRARDEW